MGELGSSFRDGVTCVPNPSVPDRATAGQVTIWHSSDNQVAFISSIK